MTFPITATDGYRRLIHELTNASFSDWFDAFKSAKNLVFQKFCFSCILKLLKTIPSVDLPTIWNKSHWIEQSTRYKSRNHSSPKICDIFAKKMSHISKKRDFSNSANCSTFNLMSHILGISYYFLSFLLNIQSRGEQSIWSEARCISLTCNVCSTSMGHLIASESDDH